MSEIYIYFQQYLALAFIRMLKAWQFLNFHDQNYSLQHLIAYKINRSYAFKNLIFLFQ